MVGILIIIMASDSSLFFYDLSSITTRADKKLDGYSEFNKDLIEENKCFYH